MELWAWAAGGVLRWSLPALRDRCHRGLALLDEKTQFTSLHQRFELADCQAGAGCRTEGLWHTAGTDRPADAVLRVSAPATPGSLKRCGTSSQLPGSRSVPGHTGWVDRTRGSHGLAVQSSSGSGVSRAIGRCPAHPISAVSWVSTRPVADIGLKPDRRSWVPMQVQ